MKKLFSIIFMVLMLAVITVSCTAEDETETRSIRVLATSDLHGKFVPWDYSLNEESLSGSVAQLATAVAAFRTPETLLVDAGDSIQGNASDIFAHLDSVHPMVQAINALDYDVWVIGNHEFDYSMDIIRKTISDLTPKVLIGNMYDETGRSLADSYAIFDMNGVRVAVIGMVTPNIARWNSSTLADCTVTDPLEETRKAIDAIRGQYDVLIGVFHMGLENELGTPNSGVTDILNACPEFDVMVSSHSHKLIQSMDINGVLVVQNKDTAQTMSVIDLTLEKSETGWKLTGKTAESVNIADYAPDSTIMALLSEPDAFARNDALQVVGRLDGGPLVPDNEIAPVPAALIQDTALAELIHEVLSYYSGAAVAATYLPNPSMKLAPGNIRKSDTSQIYKYANMLYKLRMTGAQLKKYMEVSAGFYNTFNAGDLFISFTPGFRQNNYYMFSGIRYEIDVSAEPGSRILNLTWPDGTPVRDDDVLEIAIDDYQANSRLLVPGVIFDADDLPVVVEQDVRSDIGSIRDMICDYIVNVKGGVITPECDNNWKLTGYEWDTTLHQKAIELYASGQLTLPESTDGRSITITVDDLKNFE